ncbi:MAG TPA: hypothetical protein VKY74_00775 [Chloroflexia bacterium]|nr:hypothetical protein [Chloroflexia bacterium]
MPFLVANRRTSAATLRKRHGAALQLDLTSRGPDPWMRFSPFYPHGGIPVPFSPGVVAASVEGIWQGLKVFEKADVDPARLAITTMHGLKRSSRTYGKVRGHRAGLTGTALLPYAEARQAIYLPAYRWVLEHRLADLVAQLRTLGATETVLLLDYETNCDPTDLSSPLSHAGLVKHYLDGTWPGDR